MTANPLVGTWRLVSVENRDSEGSVTYPFGRNPVGFITYTADGRMAVQFGRADRVGFASDFSFDAFDWQASVRGRATRHLLIEGMLDQWRHTKTSRRTNVPLLGPSGPIGHIDELTTETLDSMTAVGVNLLGTGTVGRVRISGGGGPGKTTGHLCVSVFRAGLDR